MNAHTKPTTPMGAGPKKHPCDWSETGWAWSTLDGKSCTCRPCRRPTELIEVVEHLRGHVFTCEFKKLLAGDIAQGGTVKPVVVGSETSVEIMNQPGDEPVWKISGALPKIFATLFLALGMALTACSSKFVAPSTGEPVYYVQEVNYDETLVDSLVIRIRFEQENIDEKVVNGKILLIYHNDVDNVEYFWYYRRGNGSREQSLDWLQREATKPDSLN